MYSTVGQHNFVKTPSEALELSGDRNNFSKCFYPNQCHVCHMLDNKENPLKRCSNCRIMAYCGKEHQVKDWKMHSDFCKILKELGGPEMFGSLKEFQDPINASNETKFRLLQQRDNQKQILREKVAKKLNRPPFLYEIEAICNPRVCAVCYENDQSLLMSCFNCPQVTFCKKHKSDSYHLKVCHLFKRAREITSSNTYQLTIFNVVVRHVKFVNFLSQKPGTRLPNSMEDFLTNESCIQGITRCSGPENVFPKNIFEILLTDVIYQPLTILYALEKMEFPVSSNLTVHFMAPTVVDLTQTRLWELMFHWLPKLIKLTVIFIGPQISVREIREDTLCSTCIQKKVKIDFQLSSATYERYMKSSAYVKPNIIVVFNAEHHVYPIWHQDLKFFKGLCCPFLQTFMSEIEAHHDHKLIRRLVPGVKQFYVGLNPFSSYRYERNSEVQQISAIGKILAIYDVK